MYKFNTVNRHKADLAEFHLFICNLTFYKADTSLRRTAEASPKGVKLRQSSL